MHGDHVFEARVGGGGAPFADGNQAGGDRVQADREGGDLGVADCGQRAAETARRPYDGVVALGCVIRGDTIHFEIVSNESARGLMDIGIARGLPIGNGIITVNTEAQAFARARPEEMNKGGDAARAALALVRLKRQWAAR